MKIPTDLKILEYIFNHYMDDYLTYETTKNREAKIHVPIDIDHVAKHFDIEGDLVFGRLYYHLNPKYQHDNSDGITNYLFNLSVGRDRHCINFPMLSSIVADLSNEHSRFKLSLNVAILAAIVSIFSLGVAIKSELLNSTNQIVEVIDEQRK
ncbi:hypothetical protein [Vibrio hippocampi]|uniref:Uncharacterized protein n=1 Tax=Vibrio hippocampi TaxID=654686 RepID=A0ABM8ZGN5_9VIBR|nr:hypothetical protein [Vibrio hippocampi]CAH0525526.1 hypothetical protein VHP8226_01052 [Vibrio hippocampi]